MRLDGERQKKSTQLSALTAEDSMSSLKVSRFVAIALVIFAAGRSTLAPVLHVECQWRKWRGAALV